MTTAHELVQQAIDKIERPRKKRRVQDAFDKNPDKIIGILIEECDEHDGDEIDDCDDLADYLEGSSSAIDPEKLSKWVELLLKLLPLILKFL